LDREPPLKATDQCVLCGLCLPHCPTYRLSRNEAESPRGRIFLMQALGRGQLPADAALSGHLDHCLVCRACEKVCPSKVPYGALIDEARALLAPTRRRPPVLQRLLDTVSDKKGRLRPFLKGLRLYQQSGAQWLARKSGLLKGLDLDGLEAALPAVPPLPDFPAYAPPTAAHRGDVALFTGCLGEAMDAPALTAALRLLTRLGYGVHIPAAQGCCGSLHQHAGERESAACLAAANHAAFQGLEITAIVTTATGCGAQLAESSRLFGEETAMTAPVRDICDFLLQVEWPAELRLRPLPRRVAVHEPCSARNLLGNAAGVYALLARIPQLEAIPLAGNDQCCGAAGSYMITQPEWAGRLRRDKVEALRRERVDALATANYGCGLHIAAGFGAERAPRVVHPVVLLAEALG